MQLSLNHLRSAFAHWGTRSIGSALQAIQALPPKRRPMAPWVTLRTLSNHCVIDIDEGARSASARPPQMFRLPQQGLPRYLLTGAFTLEQVQEWNKNNHRAAVTRWATEPQEAAPRNLHLISASPDDAAQWANANGIPIASQTGPHYMVCNHTATKQHLDQGAWEPHHELNHLRRNFDARILRFSNASTDQPRLTQYENPITRSIHYALICNDRRLRLPRSDGIYALLHLAEKTVLRYNEEQHVLLVPLRAPLPDFLARAVFLASGINPRHEVLEDTKQNALAYPAIHPQMASTIFDELGQDWSQR